MGLQAAKAAFERDSVIAYQTVRIHWMTKRKKGRLPSFASVIGGSTNTLTTGDSNAKAQAFLNRLAAATGGRLRTGKPRRVTR